jgi:hypothetical protein
VVVLVMSAVSVLLALGECVRHRRKLARTSRDGLVTPFDGLEEADRVAR